MRFFLGFLIALVLAACGAAPTVPPDFPFPPEPPAADCPFVLPESAVRRCGYLTVPARRGDPDSPTLQIAYAVLAGAGPATTDGATVFLNGGPGESSRSLLWNLREAARFSPVDLVVFDGRGVGQSRPALDCPEAPSFLLLWRPDDFDRAVDACLADLRARGLDLRDFSTAAATEDVLDLVRVLGYRRVNLYGASYGTLLAQRIMERSPETVRAAVLDGVIDPARNWAVDSTRAFQGSLAAVGEACRASVASCARFDVRQALDETAAFLDTAGLTMAVPTPVPFTADIVFENLRGALYRQNFLADLPLELVGLARRDVETAVRWARRSEVRLPASLGAFVAVTCQDTAATDAEIEAAHADLWPVLKRRAAFVKRLNAVCGRLGLTRRADPAPVVSDVPTLLISGRFDPVTPPAWARSVAARLSRSQSLEFAAGSHVNGLSGECGLRAVLGFLAAPDRPLDLPCAATPLRFPYD